MSALEKTKNFISHPILVTLLRVALGGVFIWASIDKIMNPDAFAQNIANYRLMPYQTINLMAIVLPWLEFIVGAVLIAGIWIKSGVIIINGMLLVFIVAITQALVRDLDISCGCFDTNPEAHRMSRMTLYWDIIWFAWGVIVIAFDNGKYSLTSLLMKTRKQEGK